jgi:hypothetical protein
VNLFSELQRFWFLDPVAVQLCPIEKIFTGQVPDVYTDNEGKERDLNPPYVCIWSPDGSAPGGTSGTIEKHYTVQVSCFHTTRAAAESMRNYARSIFEDCDIQLAAALGETFQDISLDTDGELPPRNGVYEFFQRFNVETAISRPRRKRV